MAALMTSDLPLRYTSRLACVVGVDVFGYIDARLLLGIAMIVACNTKLFVSQVINVWLA